MRRGRLEPEVARLLSLLEAQRLQATYDVAAVVTPGMAADALKDASAFVGTAERLLRQDGYLN